MNMTKKNSRIIGLIMLVVAVIFLVFAMGHPEMSFSWSNSVTYVLYIVYLVAMVIFLRHHLKRSRGTDNETKD